MGEYRDIAELPGYIASLKDVISKAQGLSLIRLVTLAEGYAKENYKKQFKGRRGYVLSGSLLNAIKSGLYTQSRERLEGYVGVFGIPYGRIHEVGGIIKPVKAKNLWVKNYEAPKKFKSLTPSEFMRRRETEPINYFLANSKQGNLIAFFKRRKKDLDFIPLFFLKKRVKIPQRPYLKPAVDRASPRFFALLQKELKALSVGLK